MSVQQAFVPPSTVDRPFGCPDDTVLHLPPPLSVNKSRRFDPASTRGWRRWADAADAEILAAGGMRRFPRMEAAFEIQIVLDSNLNKLDLDNAAKGLIDYCKRIGLIKDDSPRYLRRIVMEWGHAPHGCRVTLRPAA